MQKIYRLMKISLESKILVVDDIHTNTNLVKAYLKNTHLDVLVAHNGRDAIRLAKEYNPDLILMDIQMSPMDGFQSLRKIRETNSVYTIPIIAFSASIMPEQEVKVFEAGFTDFLKKPFRKQELFYMLKKHLTE